MSHQARIGSLMGVVHNTPRSVEYPTTQGRPMFPSEIFGQNVFGLKELKKALPKPVYASFIKQLEGKERLDKVSVDAIAHAVRVWSQERGATHFTHWFQPQTGSTAEKHDSFLTLGGSLQDPKPMDAFSGSQLLQSEPDASSFPSGGMRSTFEARGYTVWDTSSPMFIRPGALLGTYTLYIPCVFISYNGEALDEKTILLRSQEAINTAVCGLLKLIGENESRVFTTLGCEQEYFMIDRSLYSMRLDLKLTGRTMLGSVPPKHQQLEDHYFGRIPSRVLAAMSESELELLKLGVPVKTRHNEVAPSQFEMAPIFEEAAVAVDHNLLVMDVMHQVAHRHKLKVLFHEKPFLGVNGSGKHCNWSLSTEKENLLDPGVNPEQNYRFLLCLLSTMLGVLKHQGLLRASISSASNDHRLGANEAPPAIISCFLGKHLDEVLDSIEQDKPLKPFQSQLQTIKLGGTVLDLQVNVLPEIQRDLTDRNRTSPLAFTGNKFEFRAVGSRQSPSFPVAMLSACAAAGFLEVQEMLKKDNSKQNQLKVIRELIKMTKAIRFEGDNYLDKWREEAKQRKLLIIPTTPDAYDQLMEEKNVKMLTDLKIFSKPELHSRHHVLMEKYAKDLLIEANTMFILISQVILPSAFEYRKFLSDSVKNLREFDDDPPEKLLLLSSTKNCKLLQSNLTLLEETIQKVQNDPNQAKLACKEIVPLLQEIRKHADSLEKQVADKYWPLPKYTEILFH